MKGDVPGKQRSMQENVTCWGTSREKFFASVGEISWWYREINIEGSGHRQIKTVLMKATSEMAKDSKKVVNQTFKQKMNAEWIRRQFYSKRKKKKIKIAYTNSTFFCAFFSFFNFWSPHGPFCIHLSVHTSLFSLKDSVRRLNWTLRQKYLQ